MCLISIFSETFLSIARDLLFVTFYIMRGVYVGI